MSFDLDQYLALCRQAVDRSLRAVLNGHDRSEGVRSERSERAALDKPTPDYLSLKRAMGCAALDGGKRLRPCLVIAACEAVGGTQEQALVPACAVELLHAYSLVHDDLPAMDDDEYRRGKPTCHKAFGEAAAILAGDALQTYAFEILAAEALRCPDRLAAIVQAALELAQAAGVNGMVGGQAMDIALKNASPDFETLEACHALKTAALFRASTTMGALVGGGTAIQVSALRSYGLDLGLAFQHADDLKDAEFPTLRAQSLDRASVLASRAEAAAVSFGDRGIALAALARWVAQRAQEAVSDAISV